MSKIKIIGFFIQTYSFWIAMFYVISFYYYFLLKILYFLQIPNIQVHFFIYFLLSINPFQKSQS